MACKNICKEIEYVKDGYERNGYYLFGAKRCMTCERFVKWPNAWCPCCGQVLRTKPRSMKQKRKLIEIVRY